MFETQSFRDELKKVVAVEAGRNNMKEYETTVVSHLQDLASANESILMDRELRKLGAQRRGVPDALKSAEELTREASRYASSEGRTVLTISDIEKAYKEKFCQYWPFCRS